MPTVITNLVPSFKILFKDKVLFVLTLIPIIIGLTIYVTIGMSFFSSSSEWGQGLVQNYVSEGGFGTFLVYMFKVLIAVLMYFFVNFTFVLVVSLLASPFNDLLSKRIEKILLGEKLPDFFDSFEGMGGKLISVLFNEIKKISLILLLTTVSFIFAYIPFMAPVSIVIAMILLAIEYLDYSWSRHDLAFWGCIKDLKKNIVSYTLGGGFFFFLITIPVVNLFVPAFGTSFFTHLWVRKNEYRNQAT